MDDHLSDQPVDPELKEGAHNAIRVCLDVQPHEAVVVVTDRPTLAIGVALAAEARKTGAPVQVFVLEDLGPRPATRLPRAVAEGFERAQVSVFAAQAMPGELAMRRAMTAIVNRRRMRHGHMVGVTRRIMTEGMRADYVAVDELTQWVMAEARRATEIACTTPAGTDLRARFDPKLRWIPTSGLIRPEKWGNLPGGETFTSPARVDGVFVVDGVLGDWLAPKYGDMRATPLTIHIEDSRIVKTECDHEQALRDFRAYTSTDENSARVGEYALGTNLAVKELIGNMLQDEKIPGVHIAFGHPYSEHTGARWTSTTHVDVVGRDFDVWFDGRKVMETGRYLRNGRH